jgi:hypothetical protein
MNLLPDFCAEFDHRHSSKNWNSPAIDKLTSRAQRAL